MRLCSTKEFSLRIYTTICILPWKPSSSLEKKSISLFGSLKKISRDRLESSFWQWVTFALAVCWILDNLAIKLYRLCPNTLSQKCNFAPLFSQENTKIDFRPQSRCSYLYALCLWHDNYFFCFFFFLEKLIDVHIIIMTICKSDNCNRMIDSIH